MNRRCVDSIEPDEYECYFPSISLAPLAPTDQETALIFFQEGLGQLIRDYHQRRPDEEIEIGLLRLQLRCQRCGQIHRHADRFLSWSPSDLPQNTTVTIDVPAGSDQHTRPEHYRAIAASLYETVAPAIESWCARSNLIDPATGTIIPTTFTIPTIHLEIALDDKKSAAVSLTETDA